MVKKIKKLMMRLLVCGVCSVCFFAGLAKADDANVIKQLERDIATIQSLIDQQYEGTKTQILWDGDPLIEDVGDYYAVTMPDLTVQSLDQSQKMHVGLIALNVVPLVKTDKEDVQSWSASVALPTPIILEQNNEKAGRIDLGEQNSTIVWNVLDQKIEKTHFDVDQIKFHDLQSDLGFETRQTQFKKESGELFFNSQILNLKEVGNALSGYPDFAKTAKFLKMILPVIQGLGRVEEGDEEILSYEVHWKQNEKIMVNGIDFGMLVPKSDSK